MTLIFDSVIILHFFFSVNQNKSVVIREITFYNKEWPSAAIEKHYYPLYKKRRKIR